MKLIEALEALKLNPAHGSPAFVIQLACGFTPLHFSTFLGAHLRRGFPGHQLQIVPGIFGDLPGNLERLSNLQGATIVAILEWQDLDSRLGIRTLGGWAPAQIGDLVRAVSGQATRIVVAVKKLAEKNTIVFALPTLPIPPAAFTPGWLSGRLEGELQFTRASLMSELSGSNSVRIVSSQRLEQVSPLNDRFDAKSDLNTGFPYSLTHADKLAQLVAIVVKNPQPKKGLITDLDNTFWMGILGEVNPEGVSWDLDHHSQRHGLYQQLLASFADSGVLVGVASKNDPELVEEAFRQRKPLLARDRIFPLVANWGPKSDSVRKILETWNVGPDSVVFVDDSALDLAEVKSAYPDIECVPFPREDDKATVKLLYSLRDMFGKAFISEEDAIRAQSIRAYREAKGANPAEGYTPERFLQEAAGRLSITFAKDSPDSRALELLNKTNQFNLNGKRHTEASWLDYLKDPSVFLMLASYEDKYGPLGKIAVLAGRSEGSTLMIDHWVMSCRAFSRRIEHGCFLRIFQQTGADKATLQFVQTPRNQPIQDFLREVGGDAVLSDCVITREQLVENCPPVYFEVQETGL